MTVKPNGESVRLHGFLYLAVSEVCHDRDYLFYAYAQHFSGFLDSVYQIGRVRSGGTYEVPGVKSGLRLRIDWQVGHRVNFDGANPIEIQCRFEQDTTNEISDTWVGSFDLATGDSLCNVLDADGHTHFA